MKIKNVIVSAVAVFAIAATCHAVSISGEIGIVLDGRVANVNVNFATDSVKFTPKNPAAPAGYNGLVNLANGDYAGLFGSQATYQSFEYDTPTGWNPIWKLTLTPTTYFVLTKITAIIELPSIPFLSLEGEGIAHIAGFEPTHGNWSFSADAAGGGRFNYSSKTDVPDAGSSAILLGLGLIGLGLLSRKRS